MNLVRQFFTSLHDTIQDAKHLNFATLCKLINAEVAKQKEKDAKFADKIQECIAQIDKFKSWYETMSNTDENTLQVIHDTFFSLGDDDAAVICWERKKDTSKYTIQLSVQSLHKPINSDILIQHCGRALLMINPNAENDK